MKVRCAQKVSRYSSVSGGAAGGGAGWEGGCLSPGAQQRRLPDPSSSSSVKVKTSPSVTGRLEKDDI